MADNGPMTSLTIGLAVDLRISERASRNNTTDCIDDSQVQRIVDVEKPFQRLATLPVVLPKQRRCDRETNKGVAEHAPACDQRRSGNYTALRQTRGINKADEGGEDHRQEGDGHGEDDSPFPLISHDVKQVHHDWADNGPVAQKAPDDSASENGSEFGFCSIVVTCIYNHKANKQSDKDVSRGTP